METLASATTLLLSTATANVESHSDSQAIEHGALSVERDKKRNEWLRTLANRYEALSGARIDNTRISVIASELSLAGYTHAQAQAAERWILKGNPMRYGTLTYADFFPSPEQLAEVQHDMTRQLKREYDRGYLDGFGAGKVAADAEWRDNEAYMEERRRASEAVDLTARIALLMARETENDKRDAKLTEREEKCAHIEKLFRKFGGSL